MEQLLCIFVITLCTFKSHSNTVNTLQIMKNVVRFAHVPFNFISFDLFLIAFAIKLKDVIIKVIQIF